jgi:Na+-driven multidrug efflux pump
MNNEFLPLKGFAVAFSFIVMIVLASSGLGSEAQILEISRDVREATRQISIIGLIVGIAVLVIVLWLSFRSNRRDKNG